MHLSIAKFIRSHAAAIWNVICLASTTLLYYRWYPLPDSDCSSEMVLAKLLLEGGGGILTKQWCYSTELRVLNTQLIYQVGLFLFPNSWHLARTFSLFVMLVLLYLSARFLLKRLDVWDRCSWVVGALFLPLGVCYSYVATFFSFYVPHLCIGFVAFGLFADAVKSQSPRRRRISLAAGIALAFVSGLGGVRQPVRSCLQ